MKGREYAMGETVVVAGIGICVVIGKLDNGSILVRDCLGGRWLCDSVLTKKTYLKYGDSSSNGKGVLRAKRLEPRRKGRR